ncbi:MAG: trypsin-like peptidase domain-containing protein [Planctomycetia bacterium]|nr:trypsin-like peptidase domain-containing protein [Planctomycetia bacterium]
MRKHLILTLLCAVFAFLGGVTAEVFLSNGGSASAQPGPPLPPVPPLDPNEKSLPDRFQAVIKQVGPSVVAVDAVRPPAPGSKPEEESGSGVMVKLPNTKGVVVVTNNHVVGAAQPNKVYVTLSDGRIVQPARIWADPESDISLLNLEDDSLPVIPLGDSDRVRRGQWVLAFGSPFGLNQTVTHGIISATNRGQISLGSTIRIKEFLQTDAAINPGSSGGPLVNLDGKVIGINTAIASKSGSNSGVSFSIPANMVKRVATQLIDKGVVTRGYLGVQLASTLEPAEALRLGLTHVSGALVEIVHPSTPAEAAGLRVGDVVLKLEDVAIKDENHLINLVCALPPGQRVRLTIWRDRKLQALDVTLGDYATRGRTGKQ